MSEQKRPGSAAPTPGVWEIEPLSNGYTWEVWAGPKESNAPLICRVEDWERDPAEGMANANLIVAAKDMLAALDAALNWFSPPNDSKTAFPAKQIAEAAAKARGVNQ